MREGGGGHASAKPDTSVLFRALFMHMAEGVALHESPSTGRGGPPAIESWR